MYNIELSPMARREFKKLPKKIQIEIANVIDELKINPIPEGCKKLKGVSKKIQSKLEIDCIYRIRSNDYRILYSVNNNEIIIYILKIGARKDVYDFLKRGL